MLNGNQVTTMLPVKDMASASADDPPMGEFEGAHAHHEGKTPPVPEWKKFPQFNEVLPKGDPAK
jgi:hypothetical protein